MKKKSSQKGSALIYILIAIALLAALTATFMDSSSQQTTSQNAFNTVTDLNSQINFVRSAIQECVLTYPSGDDALAGVATNMPYPINPSSTYLTDEAANDEARNIRCPGNPGNSADHADIFAGSSGKFMPPAPSLFGEWTYYNGVDGVFFYIATDKTDAFLETAMKKLDDQFSECEADLVDNDPGGAPLAMTTEVGGPTCPVNSLCFRVWMIAQASAIYPGDTAVLPELPDETACP